ncbi:MAG: hypothetical protein ABTD50_24505 [Polyangiaceae bacterium]
MIDLDEADGWIHLVSTCDSDRDSLVVVNSAARNNISIKNHGQTVDSSLDELGTKRVAFWVINRQRDSLEFL